VSLIYSHVSSLPVRLANAASSNSAPLVYPKAISDAKKPTWPSTKEDALVAKGVWGTLPTITRH
jgi:hypothetical protein